jgi:hypothetical protein
MDREIVYYPFRGPILLDFVRLAQEVNSGKPILILQESTRGELWKDRGPISPQDWKPKKAGE